MGLWIAAFQNLRGGHQEDTVALDNQLVSKKILWDKKLSRDHCCSPSEPFAHLCCRWTLYPCISLGLWHIASCNFSYTFQGFRKLWQCYMAVKMMLESCFLCYSQKGWNSYLFCPTLQKFVGIWLCGYLKIYKKSYFRKKEFTRLSLNKSVCTLKPKFKTCLLKLLYCAEMSF